MIKKCDIIVPVYKSPEWVVLCLYAVFKNTKSEVLNKVYLIDDCDDETTDNCLNNLKNKYGSKVEILKNKKRLGFIGSTNRGMKESKADYVLLLNTDCIITNGTIEKMIDNIESDSKIGLICPISSNAANLTLDMLPGFNFSDMNKLLERKFKGKLFDACTVVGNCLLITRKCIQKVGYLDEAYGMGYGEETDYQFKAMTAGFTAKVSIDTYVFHKSEVSFGTSNEKQEKLKKNRDLFFSRWGKEYNKAMELYENNDPIKYIKNNLTDEDKKIKLDIVIYLTCIVQNAGGVHVVVDMVNYLAINGINANVIYDTYGDYKEIMLFNPICSTKADDIEIKNIVSTIWFSVFPAKKIAEKKNSKLLYFVQGYECLFENASIYGMVETSMKVPDSILTISKYLQNQIKENYGLDSFLISNGINYDLISKKNNSSSIRTITMILRNNVMKGDWILIDLLRKIDNKFKDLNINVVYMSEYMEFPALKNNKLNKYLGPLKRNDVIELLQRSDCYIDASMNEGFGLTPLEAMAAGNAVIVSNSFGINDYIKDGINGYIINEVNDSSKYIEKIEELISNPTVCKSMRLEAYKSAANFDYQLSVEKYISYFSKPTIIESKLKLSERDSLIIENFSKSVVMESAKKRKVYYIAKIIPNGLKNRIKRVITFLYNSYEH